MEYFLATVPDMAPSGAADSANAAEWLAHLTAQACHAHLGLMLLQKGLTACAYFLRCIPHRICSGSFSSALGAV